MGVNWKDTEVEYLKKNFENKSNFELAKELNRSKKGIIKKMFRLGLKRTKFMSATQVAEILKVDVHVILKWKKKGLKMVKRNKKYKNSGYKIRLERLIDFLYDNQNLWDASKLEFYALGQEPIWLQMKRKKDFKTSKKGKRWTKEEESRLIMLRNRNLTNEEIAEILGRTKFAVSRKYCILYHAKIKKVG